MARAADNLLEVIGRNYFSKALFLGLNRDKLCHRGALLAPFFLVAAHCTQRTSPSGGRVNGNLVAEK